MSWTPSEFSQPLRRGSSEGTLFWKWGSHKWGSGTGEGREPTGCVTGLHPRRLMWRSMCLRVSLARGEGAGCFYTDPPVTSWRQLLAALSPGTSGDWDAHGGVGGTWTCDDPHVWYCVFYPKLDKTGPLPSFMLQKQSQLRPAINPVKMAANYIHSAGDTTITNLWATNFTPHRLGYSTWWAVSIYFSLFYFLIITWGYVYWF